MESQELQLLLDHRVDRDALHQQDSCLLIHLIQMECGFVGSENVDCFLQVLLGIPVLMGSPTTSVDARSVTVVSKKLVINPFCNKERFCLKQIWSRLIVKKSLNVTCLCSCCYIHTISTSDLILSRFGCFFRSPRIFVRRPLVVSNKNISQNYKASGTNVHLIYAEPELNVKQDATNTSSSYSLKDLYRSLHLRLK